MCISSEDAQRSRTLGICRRSGWPRNLGAADDGHLKLIILPKLEDVYQCHQLRNEWYTGTSHLLSGDVWPEVILVEKLLPKSDAKQLKYAGIHLKMAAE